MKRILYISLLGVFVIGGCAGGPYGPDGYNAWGYDSRGYDRQGRALWGPRDPNFIAAEEAEAEQPPPPRDQQTAALSPQKEEPLLTENDQIADETADTDTLAQHKAEVAPPLAMDDNKETVIPETLSDIAMPVPQGTQAVENERQQPVDFNETFSKRNAAIAAKIEELKTRIASFVKGLSEKELRVYQKYVASSQGDDVAQWERNRKELYEVLTRENAKIFDALKEEYTRLEAEQAELLREIQLHTQRAAAKSVQLIFNFQGVGFRFEVCLA